jgi:autotransporter-associated beta strand protein/T5SS/PEP-CTERM-associated repeat protein
MNVRALTAGCAALVALAGPVAAQTPPAPYTGVNFLGPTQTQTTTISGITLEPPDTMGAVGPNNFVQWINGSFTVYNKAGTQVQQMSDGTFWGNAGTSITSARLSDPRILYDPVNQRWVAVMISTNESTNNRILIARSDSADPSGTWKSVVVTANNNLFADYPTLGMTADNVAVGTNNFTASGNSNPSVSLYNLPKTDLYAATPVTTDLSRFDRTHSAAGVVLQPTVNYGPTSGGVMAVMSTSGSPFSNYVRTTLTNPALGSASYSSAGTNVPITAYTLAPKATQPGSSTVLDTLNDRFTASVIQQGNLLYMANAVASSTSRVAVRFTVVDATTNAAVFQTTLQEANADYFMPAVAVNPSGDVVIGMNITRTTGNPNGTLMVSPAAIVGATTNFTSWAFNTPTVLATGNGNYTGTRWGDYSATTLDPADPGIFWTTQERTGSSGSTSNWATQVTEVIPVKANEVRWQAAATGNYATGPAWFGGVAPGPADHAIFSRWSAANYTVTLPAGGVANDRLSVRQTGTGTLTLSIPAGATWGLTNATTATPSFIVSEFQGQSNVTVSGGGTLSTKFAVIGGQAASAAALTVTGAGTTWANANDVALGTVTTGPPPSTVTLSIQSGAAVTVGGTLTISQGVGSTTQVTVGSAGAAATLAVGGLANGSGAVPQISLANPASTLTVTDGLGTNFGGNLTGPGQLVKDGAGTFTLSGLAANTNTGLTTAVGGTLVLSKVMSVSAVGGSLTVGAGATLTGTVRLAATQQIPIGSDLTVNAGTFDLNGFRQDVNTFSGAGGTVNLNAGTLVVNSPAAAAYAGVVTGAGDLTFQGAGTLTLSGANTFTANLFVDGGVLRAGGNSAIGPAAVVSMDNAAGATLDVNGFAVTVGGLTSAQTASLVTLGAGSLTVNAATAQSFAGVITGAGSLTVSGPGSLTLTGTGANTFTGPTTVSAGTLVLAKPDGVAAIGGDLLVAGGLAQLGANNQLPASSAVTVNAGTFDLNGFAQTLALLQGAGGTVSVGAGALTVNQPAGTATYAGAVTGSGSFTKTGPGTLVLTGTSPLTGPTQVNGGTLRVGAAGALTASPVTVGSGGTLAGTGTVGGTVAVNGGGTLAPGNGGGGALTATANVSFANTGALAVGLGTTGASDALAVQGASTVVDFATGSVLRLLPAGFVRSSAAGYTVVTMPAGGGAHVTVNTVPTAGGQVLGTFVQGVGPAGPVTIDPAALALVPGDTFTLSRTGDAVALSYTPAVVPEPAAVLGIAAAGLAAGALARRRRVVLSCPV